MRSKGPSLQLTLIIILMIILIALLGTLVYFAVAKDKEAVAPPEEIVSSDTVIEEPSESIFEESSEEVKPSEEAVPSEEVKPSEEVVPSEEVKPSEEAKPQPPKKPVIPVNYEINQKVFDKAGASYEKREIIKNGYISNENIAVRNRTFNENLYITADASDGDIVLQNVIVKGKIIVNGSSRLTLHDVKAGVVEINNNNRENTLIVSGVSTIERLNLKNSCSIIEDDLTEGYRGVKSIVIEENPKYLWIDLDLDSANVDLIYAGTMANIDVDRDSYVDKITAARTVHIGNYGEVNDLSVYDDNVTYETRPLQIHLNGNVNFPEYSRDRINLRTK